MLSQTPHIGKLQAYMKTPQWKSRLDNAAELFANHKPSHAVQYMYSHVPTTPHKRDEWLAER